MTSFFDRFLGRPAPVAQPQPQQQPARATSWPVRWNVSALVGNGGGPGLTQLIFPAPPNGITWIGSVSITGGTANDLFTAYLGQPGPSGTPLSSWLAGSTYGPVAVTDMQTLTVTGLSFNLGATLTAVFSGVAYIAGNEPGSFPLPLATTGSSVHTVTVAGGVTQTFVVPAGVKQVILDTAGAAGGALAPGSSSGLGGRVQAVLTVTPGDTLTLVAGRKGVDGSTTGTGGAPGGGNGGVGPIDNGGGGGGYSAVTDTTTATVLAVAGAGGGASLQFGTVGGKRGGLVGAAGTAGAGAGLGRGGGGGTQAAGGAGGAATGTGTNGTAGASLAGGVGGNPAVGTDNCGGGGGAGFFGGGGGGGASAAGTSGSGGGGSSFTVAGATSVAHTQGFQIGDGYVFLTYIA